MQRSESRILTSHAGSLPRPPDLLAMNRELQAGHAVDEAARAALVRASVPEVVAKQVEAGVDVINDGEYGKTNFLNYVRDRLGGFEPTGRDEQMGAMRDDRRDRQAFREFYDDELSRGVPPRPLLAATAPITYTGHALLQADIDNFKAALQGQTYVEAYMPALAPMYGGENQYYATQEEFDVAIAEAMGVEYRAIVDAGFVLQVDDPALPAFWDSHTPALTLQEYRKEAAHRVDMVNHALQGIPEDRVRYHICWGSWHGPHSTDIPLEDIVDLMLQVKAQCYSFEAANVRHEHEWRVWQDVKLPEGKVLMPGVVSHATNVLEHPRAVADRIERYAEIVGRENVIAGTDCGLGGRVHPQICWAKLQMLSEGAALASKELW
jgi:5-methyltetrahydropteroyltriglutamate--homocysteine methyltransferase